MAVEVTGQKASDVWKASNIKSPDLSSPFAWRRRVGAMASNDNRVSLKGGEVLELDELKKVTFKGKPLEITVYELTRKHLE